MCVMLGGGEKGNIADPTVLDSGKCTVHGLHCIMLGHTLEFRGQIQTPVQTQQSVAA